jgi:hypothetical protein
LSGGTDGVVGVATNLLQWHAKFQLESLLEACGDALMHCRRIKELTCLYLVGKVKKEVC